MRCRGSAGITSRLFLLFFRESGSVSMGIPLSRISLLLGRARTLFLPGIVHVRVSILLCCRQWRSQKTQAGQECVVCFLWLRSSEVFLAEQDCLQLHFQLILRQRSMF